MKNLRFKKVFYAHIIVIGFGHYYFNFNFIIINFITKKFVVAIIIFSQGRPSSDKTCDLHLIGNTIFLHPL